MPTTISEEVRTFFVGDSTGYEAAIKKVNAATAGSAAVEKKTADAIKRIRDKATLDAALAPVRAKIAEQKAAEERIKLAQQTAEKLRRQQEASLLPNIARELRDNFGGNARGKIGGFLQNSLGLSEDAAQGLVAKIGRFAPQLAVAGTAATALYKTFTAARDRAAEEAEKMRAVSDEMLKASRINVFASSTDGAASLYAAAEQARQDGIKAREALKENDPYGLGGGLMGNAGNLFMGGLARLGRLNADTNNALPFVGVLGSMGQDSTFDLQAREKDRLEKASQGRGQDERDLRRKASEDISKQLEMTRARLSFDQQTVAILELQRQEQGAIADLRKASNGAVSQKDLEQVHTQYREQVDAQEKLRDALEDRHSLELQIVGMQNSGLTSEQQSVLAARMRNEQIARELQLRHGGNREEQRGLELDRARNQELVRGAQLQEVMKSPRQQARDLRQIQIAQRKEQQAQDRLNRTDGLTRVERDINGRITGGIDIVTGERRAVSPSFVQPSSGLYNGSGLSSGYLNDSAYPAATNVASLKDSGHDNDVGHGKTLLGAQNKLIDAADIANEFLRSIDQQLGGLDLG